MGQTRNNNLSPLPIYTNRDEQQCRLPWAYGDVYPLLCDDYLLPFFFVRDLRDVVGQGTEIVHDDFDSATYLISTGNNVYEKGFKGGVSYYDDVEEGRMRYWVKDLPYPPDREGAVNVVCNDVNGETLGTQTLGVAGERYTGILDVPKGTRKIWLYSYDGEGDTASLYETAQVPRPLQSVELYLADDTLQADLTDYMLKAMSFVRTNGGDTFYYVCEDYSLPAEIPNGTYYLKFSDGSNYGGVWYSEMFSYAFNSLGGRQLVNITWYDNGNLALEQGVIPYGEKGPTDTYYTNSINVPVSVGRPEYETEKEGDERDGFFFMEKGISRKTYRFTFHAPEYLCDALRLVPVSDNVLIHDYLRNASYDVDDIDMEVEWLEQGNYAQVTFTFHTDTVVKNLGKIV